MEEKGFERWGETHASCLPASKIWMWDFQGQSCCSGGEARIRYLANTTGISWLRLTSCLNCEF